MAYLPKGVFTMPKDFKHEYYWKQLSQFTTTLQTKVSERRWEGILKSIAIADEKGAADSDDGEDSDDIPSLSVLSAYRAGICVPESPAKF